MKEKPYISSDALLHLYKWLCLFISSQFNVTYVSLLLIHAPFGTVGWNNRVNASMYVNVYVCKIYSRRQTNAALLVPGHNVPVHGQSAWVLVSEYTLAYDLDWPTCLHVYVPGPCTCIYMSFKSVLVPAKCKSTHEYVYAQVWILW